MRTLAEIQRAFLAAPRFAVVGASKDQAKFGTKVRVSNWVRITFVSIDLDCRC